MNDFTASDEQRMLTDTARPFLEREIYPYEAEVERAGSVPPDPGQQIKQRAIAQGLYAANFPLDVGGGGLALLSLALLDREFGKIGWALRGYVGRPSSILMGCRDAQVERYLLPAVRGERHECFALTEPGAGSDAMSIATKAVRDGDDYVLNGAKHFISGVNTPDFAIVLAVTGVDETPRGRRKRVTAFLVDHGTKGFEIRRGPRCVSYRAYNNYDLVLTDCRLPADLMLGDEGRGLPLRRNGLETRVCRLHPPAVARRSGSYRWQQNGRRRANNSAKPSAGFRAHHSSSQTWQRSSERPTSLCCKQRGSWSMTG